MKKMADADLLKIAALARKNACAKLSGFRVGAALLAKSGRIYSAANIESDIPALSICADRLALFEALAAGEKKFEKIAIFMETKAVTPCGACRQILFEFCGPDLKIIAANTKGKMEKKILGTLLPRPYAKERG